MSMTTLAFNELQAGALRSVPGRWLALDIVRGYAMLLMLISHSSWWLDDVDFGVAYGWDNMIVPVLDRPESSLGFILQLATPAFFLLAGFSVALFVQSRRRRGWSEARITRFLVIRGLLLITLDLTIINLTLHEPFYISGHLSVLTGMGICILLLAALYRLPLRWLVMVAALTLLWTQLYYYSLMIVGDWPREESVIRAVLLAPSVEDQTWKTQFPALAWLPVVLLGYISAGVVQSGRITLARLSLRLGVAGIVAYGVLLFAGDFGTLYPQDLLIFTKHPPDLEYITLYTGITFLLIALHSVADRLNQWLPLRGGQVFGQTALFFYVTHLWLIEAVSMVIVPQDWPVMVRLGWVIVLVLPMQWGMCLAYRTLRRRHPDSLLQYL